LNLNFNDHQCSMISTLTADWRELMITRRIMWTGLPSRKLDSDHTTLTVHYLLYICFFVLVFSCPVMFLVTCARLRWPNRQLFNSVNVKLPLSYRVVWTFHCNRHL